jgi:hypothetical protein
MKVFKKISYQYEDGMKFKKRIQFQYQAGMIFLKIKNWRPVPAGMSKNQDLP